MNAVESLGTGRRMCNPFNDTSGEVNVHVRYSFRNKIFFLREMGMFIVQTWRMWVQTDVQDEMR